MPLTPAQKTTLKAHIQANTNTINGTPINQLPINGDTLAEIAKWYSAAESPVYWVWRTKVTRRDVYFTVTDLPSAFNFTTYKSQTQSEQGTWTQMFMGDEAPFNSLALRNGVFAVFSGNAAQNTQRAHVFAVGRRNAVRVEKIFAVAPASVGGITVGVDNGNTTGDTLGVATNPAVMGYEGAVTSTDIQDALNS